MLSELGFKDAYNRGAVGLLLREQGREGANDPTVELDRCRSGSAPPTVEGSLSAVEGLFRNPNGALTEEELRSDPAYHSYYYSHVNLNPRLPPPLISKEDRGSTQRFEAGRRGLGGIGDGRRSKMVGDGVGKALLGKQLGFDSEKWLDKEGDGLIGLPGIELGRHKSFTGIFQDDFSHASHLSGPDDRSSSVNVASSDQSEVAFQKNGSSTYHSFASILGPSISRSASTDPQQIKRASSPCLPPIGVRLGPNVKNNNNGTQSFNCGQPDIAESDEVMASFSSMNLSATQSVNENIIQQSKFPRGTADHHDFLHNHQGDQNSIKHFNIPNLMKLSNLDLAKDTGGLMESSNLALREPSASLVSSPGDSPQILNGNGPYSAYTSYRPAGYSPNNPSNFAPLFGSPFGSPFGTGIASPILAPGSPGGGSFSIPNLAALQMNVDPLHNQIGNTYLDSLLQLQNQYGVPVITKNLDSGFCKSAAFGYAYPGSPLSSPLLPASPVGALRQSERSLQFPTGTRNMAGGVMGSWYSGVNVSMNDNLMPSLLEEFKSNKTKCYELSDIAGHVVEFSADQYGSRFIQQKLETATTEEKDMVYEEIMPRALKLMTDVFGNYVVQKFFEHGSAVQRRELADQLTGHVLALSLQMYGCRVIQKAIEVVDLDQQKNMVAELDGHVMRCVRDQNGNHVIQKCIECVPEDVIQFIISTFYGQVVMLSTHPYGCRVIQRVLEHCHDPETQQIMMDEILQSVCLLAQDQYGNYVAQHVLEHGKPVERSTIIKKLTGQIVQMSQQKFASNVIEKCLAFGDPIERQILINEILGSDDENEPLQVMMKDQFANYVVQKVLETCDDSQRELILTRIKLHLNALKKYTYGKHIVARVEKLVAAGERRIGAQASYTS
nr:unnamed protein product [Ananas comosus var. bracteatus]